MIKIMNTLGASSALLVLIAAFSGNANAAAVYSAPQQACYGSPGPGQAFLYTEKVYSGTCYLLQMDNSGDSWTSWDATTGFPNDKIQSVWLGPDVALVLYWNTFYTKDTGAPLHFGPYEYSADLGQWNRNASAARLQRFNFGACRWNANTVVLYENPNFGGDCTELTYREYKDPVSMGFRNDTLSSVVNLTANSVYFYKDANYNPYNPLFIICQGGLSYDLRINDPYNTPGNYSDTVSGISIQWNRMCLL